MAAVPEPASLFDTLAKSDVAADAFDGAFLEEQLSQHHKRHAQLAVGFIRFGIEPISHQIGGNLIWNSAGDYIVGALNFNHVITTS